MRGVFLCSPFISFASLALLTSDRAPTPASAQLKGEMIEKLGLRPIEGEGAVFETAAGIAMESAIYRATIRVNGREASCLLSPSEKDRLDEDEDEESDSEDEEDAAFGFDKVSDDALLGHDCLAALGLAVDCRRRRLFACHDEVETYGIAEAVS